LSEKDTIPLEWSWTESGRRGAGGGNRTHVASLEGWNSTIELHPLEWPFLNFAPTFDPAAIQPAAIPGAGGGGRIRTYEDIRRQIYSLLPLTARQPLRIRAARLSGL